MSLFVDPPLPPSLFHHPLSLNTHHEDAPDDELGFGPVIKSSPPHHTQVHGRHVHPSSHGSPPPHHVPSQHGHDTAQIPLQPTSTQYSAQVPSRQVGNDDDSEATTQCKVNMNTKTAATTTMR
ncbi:hypothetical protein EDB85DRAFT_1896394 [Lactarius pseudohatsudake]|nr:hypothetical protein EDB85DRAFT_1896394 [Lactarius pseudohatsudake]